MLHDEHHIYVGIEGFDGFKPERLCTYETKNKLIDDGVEVTDAGFDYGCANWRFDQKQYWNLCAGIIIQMNTKQ